MGGDSGLNVRADYAQDVHVYEFPEDRLRVVFQRFVQERRGVSCEVEVHSELPPRPGLLHYGRLNLSSTPAKQALARALQERAAPGWHDDTDFRAVVEYTTYRSLQRFREGEPLVELSQLREARSRWLLEPFVQVHSSTVLFGDGGTGKSTLALAIAASVATGRLLGKLHGEPRPALYLDWEADADVHAERLRALGHGHGVELGGVYYRRMTVPLEDAATTVQRDVAKLGVGLVVMDSMLLARGGDPDSADTTGRFFRAARSLGTSFLVVDHLPKHALDATKPFGSVYTHHLARLTWKLTSEPLPGALRVWLRSFKRNAGEQLRPLCYDVHWQSNGTGELRSLRFVTDRPELLPGA